ncbi:MAG: hypothetical protein GC182_20750 [Rhodopseudomonas sp.]|nr:hypothetical protein [Rhodopseudomonas sp.]
MTPSLSQRLARTTVTLTSEQVHAIAYDMGWEWEDAAIFWNLALREAKDPGCLEREQTAHMQGVLRERDGGQP